MAGIPVIFARDALAHPASEPTSAAARTTSVLKGGLRARTRMMAPTRARAAAPFPMRALRGARKAEIPASKSTMNAEIGQCVSKLSIVLLPCSCSRRRLRAIVRQFSWKAHGLALRASEGR